MDYYLIDVSSNINDDSGGINGRICLPWELAGQALCFLVDPTRIEATDRRKSGWFRQKPFMPIHPSHLCPLELPYNTDCLTCPRNTYIVLLRQRIFAL